MKTLSKKDSQLGFYCTIDANTGLEVLKTVQTYAKSQNYSNFENISCFKDLIVENSNSNGDDEGLQVTVEIVRNTTEKASVYDYYALLTRVNGDLLKYKKFVENVRIKLE